MNANAGVNLIHHDDPHIDSISDEPENTNHNVESKLVSSTLELTVLSNL